MLCSWSYALCLICLRLYVFIIVCVMYYVSCLCYYCLREFLSLNYDVFVLLVCVLGMMYVLLCMLYDSIMVLNSLCLLLSSCCVVLCVMFYVCSYVKFFVMFYIDISIVLCCYYDWLEFDYVFMCGLSHCVLLFLMCCNLSFCM